MKENGKISMGWATKSDEKTYNRSRWTSNKTSFDSRPQNPRSSRNTRLQDRITSLQQIQIVGRRQGTVNIAAIIIGNKQEDWDSQGSTYRFWPKPVQGLQESLQEESQVNRISHRKLCFQKISPQIWYHRQCNLQALWLKKKIRHVLMNCDGASFEGAGSWNL